MELLKLLALIYVGGIIWTMFYRCRGGAEAAAIIGFIVALLILK